MVKFQIANFSRSGNYLRMFRSKVLAEIESLDPVKDHQRIVFLSTRFDFPFDTTRSLELALFRTFCVPSVSGLLDKTKEFERRPQKRYDDTDIIVSEMIEWGYDSERGSAALRKMNEIHGRFKISNQDFLYVLSTFVFEPIRWNARFGWRLMTEKERIALFHFWREVGKRMSIRDIPEDLAEFEKFNIAFEREHYRFSESNRRVGESMRQTFIGWFPGVLRPITDPASYAIMDEELIEAFHYPKPSALMRRAVEGALKLRRHTLRFFPRRTRPLLRTEMKHPSYPKGYDMKTLGAEKPNA